MIPVILTKFSRALLVFVLGILLLLVIGVCTFSKENIILPKYDTIKEDLYDAPVKTQIALEILVSGEITEKGLEALLINLYKTNISRREFKYHKKPTNIFIFAYTSKERAETGSAWIARLQYIEERGKPIVDFKNIQFDLLNSKSEIIFGLNENKRKQIYKELVSTEDRAYKEAEKQEPDFRKKGKIMNRLIEKYKKELAKKYGLDLKQLEKIALEGLKKEWPMPPIE